ncbi:antitoxin [soil metagenome]
MLTRMFKSGNSIAVRIPKELAFDDMAQDVEIERKGDALLIRPVLRPSLAGIEAAFAAFPRGFMADGRETHSQKPRDWTGAPSKKSR